MARRGRAIHLRNAAGLDDKDARGDQTGDVRVIELGKKAPNVSVDRLLPDGFAALEISRYQCDINA
ncbi:MAG TPA: hypothetical protein PJ982_16690, partial [Lacipirellulaceae bacterium]|nr:hypothetical protein [Lacipirellulaceae bacterium]